MIGDLLSPLRPLPLHFTVKFDYGVATVEENGALVDSIFLAVATSFIFLRIYWTETQICQSDEILGTVAADAGVSRRLWSKGESGTEFFLSRELAFMLNDGLSLLLQQ